MASDLDLLLSIIQTTNQMLTVIAQQQEIIIKLLEEQIPPPEGQLMEVIVSGIASEEDTQYAIGTFGEFYVWSALKPDELAVNILDRLESAGIKLTRTKEMADNDKDRVSVNIRSEGLSKVKPITLEDLMEKTMDTIKQNLHYPTSRSHHATGVGSTAIRKRKYKTGVGEEYKREYEEGENE